MSKKPYVVQEDSPNLVIVPTDNIETFYEPSPKKVKESDTVLPTPTPGIIYSNVFARKSGAKLNFSGRNNDVLIDVRKVQRSPTSWAANYLQSIGGTSTKFDRIYGLASKPTSLVTNTAAKPENRETTLPYTFNQQQTNTVLADQKMEKKTTQPKININLIKPKTVPQATMTKEMTPNSNTNNITRPTDVRKEPSLPKNYKIPMQSKNKQSVHPIEESASTNNTNNICIQNSVTLKKQTLVSSSKNNNDIVKINHNKTAALNTLTYKETTDKNKIKETIQLKHDLRNIQDKYNHAKTQAKVYKNSEQLKTCETKLLKKKVTVPHIDKQYITKCDERVPSKYKECNETQTTNNKENDQPQHDKVIKQRKPIKETTLARDHNDPSPPKNTKRNISHKTNEDIIAHIKTLKEIYKLKNKKDPTFSTKIKTKKEHVSDSSKASKLEKRGKSKESRTIDIQSKRPKDKAVANKEAHLQRPRLTKEEIIEILKKKRAAAEKKSSQSEHSSSKTKKIKLSSPDTDNTAKIKRSKTAHEGRLSKSISPIKSVVSRIKTDHPSHNSEKIYHKGSGSDYHTNYEKSSSKNRDYHSQNSEKHAQRGSHVDLRAKLKRKYPKTDYRKEDYNWNHIHKKNKFATVPNGERFVPEENLIISFNAEDDNEEKPTMKKSPVKKLARKQPSPKDKKRKKIKLEINIVFGHGDTTDEESTKGEVDTSAETMENMDLSFLDDFNVDEIAECLNECSKDCAKNTTEGNTAVDINVQHSTSDNIKIIEAIANKETLILKTTREVNLSENKMKLNQEPALQSTVDNHRTCCVENLNTIRSNISTELDNTSTEVSARTETITDTYQNCNPQAEDVKKIENVSSSDTNVSFNNYQESAAYRPEANIDDTEIKSKIDLVKILQNSGVVKNTIDKGLQLVTKMEHSEIITDAKLPLGSSEAPTTMSNSESNIYSDHRDLIDALQDDNNLELNAIKSFIASTNNNTDEKNKKQNEVEMSTTVIKYSNTLHQTPITQLETIMTAAAVHNTTEILTCIKPDPDVILIDDSDGETEINQKQITKDKNVDILSNKESLRDKLDVVTSSGPARERTESILVLDKNKRDLQHVKESQLNESTEVILVEPTGDNSESVLVLDTDYGIEESVDNSEFDENNDGANTQNIITAEQSKPNKTAVGDIFNETKTNIVENNFESEKTIIQDKVTNEIQPGTTNTDIHTIKDKDNLQKTNKTDTKPSDKPPKTEDIPKKIVPKTIPDIAKKQNVSTRLDTNSHKDTEAKYSEENEVARSNLANNKFVQILQSRMLLMLGEKCTVTEVIRFDGRFSKIYRCIDSRKQDFAIKILKKQSNGYNLGFQKKNMMMELQNGVPANNLNCVRLITGFVASGLWCYFMEYYPMNLEQAFFENKRSFHIDHVQILSRQLVSAVTILRNNNIIHSDIKPSHILINSSQTRIKLCGFDQASYLEESSLLPNTGTVNYRAPELILGYPAGYGIDVWSTALVMYEMATNNKLFPGFYNNNILYQQLCTLGAIPMEMLMESQFRNAHFRGTAFMKRLGSREKVIINEIEFNGKLNTSLFQAYSNDWGKEKDIESKREDKKKLRAFLDLLSSMLAMHPRCRIAIEFVFANPFIYESFDDC